MLEPEKLFALLQENGDWQGNFPMPVRITSAMNETLEDTITSRSCRLQCSRIFAQQAVMVHQVLRVF